jgi:tetratricopeptide (TPR) repeat protein
MPLIVAVLLLVVLAPAQALAADTGPVDEPKVAPRAPSPPSAEARYNQGVTLAQEKDWRQAEAAYGDAVRLRPTFAEAWNGLGFALRNQGRYDESVRAYQEALRLRPSFPQALEYLGHAYVHMGRLDEAKAVLGRLRSLDPREADELAQAIAQAARR